MKANGGKPQKVLDPFGGGGAIPLEALRLGCETYSNDYDPVAVHWNILRNIDGARNSEEKEMKSYKELEVWQKAIELVIRIYKQTQYFPTKEKYGITSQIRRAECPVLWG